MAMPVDSPSASSASVGHLTAVVVDGWVDLGGSGGRDGCSGGGGDGGCRELSIAGADDLFVVAQVGIERAPKGRSS